jgi:hypothetical protein
MNSFIDSGDLEMPATYSFESFVKDLDAKQKAFGSNTLPDEYKAEFLDEAYVAGTEAWGNLETPAEMATVADKLKGELKKQFLLGVKATLDQPQNVYSRPAATMRDWVDIQLAPAPAFDPFTGF